MLSRPGRASRLLLGLHGCQHRFDLPLLALRAAGQHVVVDLGGQCGVFVDPIGRSRDGILDRGRVAGITRIAYYGNAKTLRVSAGLVLICDCCAVVSA
jgi:hypothetical protein